MKKLVLAAVLAASLSAPVMAADVVARPWPWESTLTVTSVVRFNPLSKLVVSGQILENPYINGDRMTFAVNPTVTLLSSSAVTLNGNVISLPGVSGFNALKTLVGATCVVTGETPHLVKSYNVIKATCTK